MKRKALIIISTIAILIVAFIVMFNIFELNEADSEKQAGENKNVQLTRQMYLSNDFPKEYQPYIDELKKKYGLEDAKRWLKDEWNGRMYLHDGYNASLKQYCFAIDIDSVARRGLFFLENYNAEPPKHFTTFNQMVVETVSYLSNRQSGKSLCPYASFLVCGQGSRNYC